MPIEKSALLQKTINLLELGVIQERLARCSMSEEAAVIIREEKSLDDPAEVTKTKAAVQAVISRIHEGGEPRRYLPSIGFLFPRLGVEGIVLEIDEACAIGLFCERGEELKKWLLPHPVFAAMLSDMPDCEELATAVFRVMDREGNIRDLPELRAIKRRIQSLNAGLESAVSRYIASEDVRRMLQSTVPSQRDGRTVLALKANFRGRVRGIVHEVSSSGQTIFVEPEDVVEKNNEILIEQRNLDAEIRKILLNVTKLIAERCNELLTFHRIILSVEVLMAKARYSLESGGVFSEEGNGELGIGDRGSGIGDRGAGNREQGSGIRDCSSNNATQSLVPGPQSPSSPQSLIPSPRSPFPPQSLILKQARHPLLDNAVPIDLTMDGNTLSLIITGPNTGGKTVALKTAGLFAMMNQLGLALPAARGTVIPVFDGVYADIGDEQSIGQSLSTFSAHITNIANIINYSTSRSLVLLDELGSGTDPQEGSAIAMAILDCLIEKNARLIITTHHGILKNYGYSREAVENASVEFDSRTLSPTYRIITGIPGESRALDIAARNGLPPDIIAKAKSYLDSGYSDVSALISGLKEKHRELDNLTEKAKSEDLRLLDIRRKADLKELRLRQKEFELKSGLAGKLRLLLDESRKTLENLVRELKEGEMTREKTLKVKEFLGELARTVDAENAALEEEEQAIADERGETTVTNITAEFIPGMEVFAGTAKRRGVLLRQDKKSSAGNKWIVEIGSLKISFPERELIPASPSGPLFKPLISTVDFAAPPAVRSEINLCGMRLEEAIETLRRQVDMAVLQGLKTFSVVHGKGDGILQKGVHQWLKQEPVVADYYFSSPEMGGFGRTEVILKS